MDAEIYEIPCFFKKGENARNYCIYNRKRDSRHLKIHEQSIQKAYKIDAHKSYAKTMEIEAKREPNRCPNPSKNAKGEP